MVLVLLIEKAIALDTQAAIAAVEKIESPILNDCCEQPIENTHSEINQVLNLD